MASRIKLPARTAALLALAALTAFAIPGFAQAGRDHGRPDTNRRSQTHDPAPGVTWQLDGGGFGHGVGMSQFGAKGYAEHGWSWQQILRHYYTGTKIGRVEPYAVRVLLESSVPSASFSGVDLACGKRLFEGKTYSASTPDGSNVVIRNAAGQKVADCGEMMNGTGGPSWNLPAKGEYRGSLQVRASSAGGVNAIDYLPIEDYVRGVVGYESPSSWPMEALRAQAVAARSYALTGSVGGAEGYDLYDDTRSQVFGGVAAEGPRTDEATDSTAGLVVSYDGRVARTYFFSTSGGHTEDVENAFGGDAVPYLRGVDDPYDSGPYHHWRRTFSQDQMEAALSGLVQGTLESIRVPERGASPRIVKAEIVGSEGTTEVDGSTLQSRLDLPDKLVFFHELHPGARESSYKSPWAL